MLLSAYVEHNEIQNEMKTKKNVFEKVYKKIDEFNYLTLSNYFLKENNLFFKYIDSKRNEEIINRFKDANRHKYNKLNVRDEVENISIFDF